MNRGHKRENKLTKQSHVNNRGNDTYIKIPIIDVVHSINLSVPFVSDPERWRGVLVEEVQ